MNALIKDLIAGLQGFVDGGECDGLFAVQSFLNELEDAEHRNPAFLADLRKQMAADAEAEALRYDAASARNYLDRGYFGNAESAFFQLYYREARKFLGVPRAIRMAEFGIQFAKNAGNDIAVGALTEAISALREEPGSELVQQSGAVANANFKCALQSILEAA